MRLKVQLFGPFRVWRNGALIPQSAWKRRKTQSLLKVLLTEPGQVFSQERLLALLFDELDPQKALRNLHARVSELRRVLEPALPRGTSSGYVLSVGKGRYRFNLDADCDIDARTFETLAERGLKHHADGCWRDAVALLEQAVKLHHGDYLAEDRYESWAQQPLARMSELYSQTLLALADGYQQLKQPQRAIRTLHAAVDYQPQREDAVRQLMKLHHASGNRGAVASVYAQCRRSLHRALDAEPSAETQTLYQDLLRSTAWSARSDAPAVAVLPFEQLNSKAEHDYFGDGLTGDVIAQLSKIGNLKVIARTSVMGYKRTRKSPRAIAQELDVNAVLEGSVQRAGNRVRVHVRLLDAKSEATLWTETYDRALHDIFAIQSEVAVQIAAALKARLSGREQTQLKRAQTDNLSAYHDYLKGRFFWNKRTRSDLLKAIEFFNKALAQDPGYALAYAGLADSYTILGWFDYLPAREMFPRGLEAARKALALDEHLAEAHTSLAYLTLNHLWDWEGARRSFLTALDLNPNYATAHQWYAEYLSTICRHDEAVASMRNALALDPLSLTINTVLSWKLYFAGDIDAAEAQCERAMELDSGFGPTHTIMGLVHEGRGHYADAIREFETEIQKSGEHFPNVASLAYVQALAGDHAKARHALEKLKHKPNPSHYHLALIHVGLCEFDTALNLLEQAVGARAWAVVYLRAVRRFAPLHDHPRFTKLIRRIGIPT